MEHRYSNARCRFIANLSDSSALRRRYQIKISQISCFQFFSDVKTLLLTTKLDSEHWLISFFGWWCSQLFWFHLNATKNTKAPNLPPSIPGFPFNVSSSVLINTIDFFVPPLLFWQLWARASVLGWVLVSKIQKTALLMGCHLDDKILKFSRPKKLD